VLETLAFKEGWFNALNYLTILIAGTRIPKDMPIGKETEGEVDKSRDL
jgi:hypothetical protein